MKKITVFCGSNSGSNLAYTLAAQVLGKAIADANITLVYGGGSVGLMGIIADAVLKNGGEVIGVLPKFLFDKEVGHKGLSQMIITETMHQRKQVMNDLADAFVAMPGGIGTFEEFFEITTWAQLGLHNKPIALYNVDNYYTHLLAFLNHSVQEGFVSSSNRQLILQADNSLDLLEKLKNYEAPNVIQWLERTRT